LCLICPCPRIVLYHEQIPPFGAVGESLGGAVLVRHASAPTSRRRRGGVGVGVVVGDVRRLPPPPPVGGGGGTLLQHSANCASLRSHASSSARGGGGGGANDNDTIGYGISGPFLVGKAFEELCRRCDGAVVVVSSIGGVLDVDELLDGCDDGDGGDDRDADYYDDDDDDECDYEDDDGISLKGGGMDPPICGCSLSEEMDGCGDSDAMERAWTSPPSRSAGRKRGVTPKKRTSMILQIETTTMMMLDAATRCSM